jgi:putative ABC transport system substrate-binding protein
MNRREAVLSLAAFGAMAAPFVARAQSARVWRVGLVSVGTRDGSKPLEEAFVAGMREHGYTLGRNLVLDSRYADAKLESIPKLVDEVIALKPDVLLGSSAVVVLASTSRTGSIPIVMCTVSDAVGIGAAKSLASSGNNVTGLSLQLHELSAKHIELMAELLPRMRRAALLMDLAQPKALSEQYERIAQSAAKAKGVSLDVYRIDGVEGIRQTFQQLGTKKVDVLLLNPAPRLTTFRKEIILGAASARLPSIGWEETYTRDGGLASYGPNFVDAYRRVASYVDRIFKGAKPANLPIEQPTKFDLVLNTNTAKALGIKIPGAILVRADRVIE